MPIGTRNIGAADDQDEVGLTDAAFSPSVELRVPLVNYGAVIRFEGVQARRELSFSCAIFVRCGKLNPRFGADAF